jgi:hypothetical protein
LPGIDAVFCETRPGAVRNRVVFELEPHLFCGDFII